MELKLTAPRNDRSRAHSLQSRHSIGPRGRRRSGRDEQRTVVKRNSYAPFGETFAPTVIDGTGYTGHVMDQATGLTYMQQRYYDPQLGRFLSVDPMPSDTTTVWNFNRYSYAANSPYNFLDPDGRATVPWGAIGEVAAKRATQAAIASQLDSPVPGPGDVVGAVILIGAVGEIGYKIYQANASDTPASAGEKVRDGTSPAAGASGKKGEREGAGGQVGADGAFDSVNGTNERSPREGVRVKDLDGGGTIETHPSSKSADYPQGTPTVKVQDATGKVETTVRFPMDGAQ